MYPNISHQFGYISSIFRQINVEHFLGLTETIHVMHLLPINKLYSAEDRFLFPLGTKNLFICTIHSRTNLKIFFPREKDILSWIL